MWYRDTVYIDESITSELGLSMTDVGLSLNREYILCDVVICKNNKFFIDECHSEDQINYVIEKGIDMSGRNYERFKETPLRLWNTMKQTEYSLYSSSLVNHYMMVILHALSEKNKLPPYLTIRKGSRITFYHNECNTYAEIEIYGMMDPTKKFKDVREFSQYLETWEGKRYCYYCGWLYTFGTQCDC